MIKYLKISVEIWKKNPKINEILIKYLKISVDGYIFLNFVSGSTNIEYIKDISTIYLDVLNLAYE